MQRGVINRRLFSLGLAGGVAAASAAAAAIIEVVPATRLKPQEPEYLPPASLTTVADIYKRMTVPITVNDQGPFAFVVDTGANQSVISDTLAAQLGLISGEMESLHGIAGMQDTATTIATLGIGKLVQKNVTLSILPAVALGGQGMLGLDRLDGQRLTLDFAGQELRISAPKDRWRTPGDVLVKAQRRAGQLTLVDADLAGIAITAFIDSGAQNTIGNLALRDLARTRHPKTLWGETPVLSATGQVVTAEIADLPQLRVGGMHLPNWPVAFADLHTFQMWKMVNRPAILIGVDILSRFQTVSLDFLRNEVRFRLPEHPITSGLS